MPTNPLETGDEFVPTTQGELRRWIEENAAQRKGAIYPVGGRTALNYGGPATIPGTLVSLSKLTQTVDFPARDMTITVEAGLRMDELAAQLRAEGQQLPVDAAQSHRATVGGVVATDTSGPRRFGYGTMRDYVIGITAVDAHGREFHAGGRVVKNVAGYDLCKMLVGSLGTLAVITQLTLRLKPLPETTAVLWSSFSSLTEIDSVLDELIGSAVRPVVLEVFNAGAAKQISTESRQELFAELPVLAVGLEGSPRDVKWQIERLTQELSSANSTRIDVVQDKDAAQLLQAFTEFQTTSNDPLTFQANLLPSKTLEFVDQATQQAITVQAHAGSGIVIGHLPDKAASVEQAADIVTPLRQLARRCRGNLVIFNCETDWKRHLPVFGDPEPSAPLMQRLKSALDPDNLLNPGRFVDSFR